MDTKDGGSMGISDIGLRVDDPCRPDISRFPLEIEINHTEVVDLRNRKDKYITKHDHLIISSIFTVNHTPLRQTFGRYDPFGTGFGVKNGPCSR